MSNWGIWLKGIAAGCTTALLNANVTAQYRTQ